MNQKEIKRKALVVLKTHYLLLVSLCIVYAFIGVNSVPYLQYIAGDSIPNVGQILDITTATNPMIKGTAKIVDSSIIGDRLNPTNLVYRDGNLVENIGPVELDTDDGVLADLVNKFTSRIIISELMSGIKSVIHSDTLAKAVFITIIMLVFAVIWFFLIRVYEVVLSRLALESRIYRLVPIRRSLFLTKCHRWIKTGWNLFIVTLIQILWMLTIVGGVIKYFEYILVPYILAENPDLSPKQALKLSSNMMYGHKLECFRLLASFIGWFLLDIFTLGLFGFFFSNPYFICTFSEYYSRLRKAAIESRVEGSELLNDRYLFEVCDADKLHETYNDVYSLLENPIPVPPEPRGFRGFLSKNLGVVIFGGQIERERSIYTEKTTKAEALKNVLSGDSYPSRLFPLRHHHDANRHDYFHYRRRYSVWSLIIMFFIFCIIGWLWEVAMHLVEDGQFINRGMLNGPWLPIYGSGGLLVLLLLYRLRSKPVICISITIIICGILEYATAWFLDYKFGMKWWDYTGYFLNIQGRICAEGLIAFATGAALMIYVLAPLIDNLLLKLRLRVMIPLCIILISLFIFDIVYTNSHPNTGEGITEYHVVQENSQP